MKYLLLKSIANEIHLHLEYGYYTPLISRMSRKKAEKDMRKYGSDRLYRSQG
jgi:hypothetical protein